MELNAIETISQAEYQELMRRSSNKHGAKRCTVHEPAHDSTRECARFSELVILEKTGNIRHLQEKPVYVLAEKVKYAGAERATPALRYEADFSYQEWDGSGWVEVVEDVKGHMTEAFKVKRHLMMAQRGIDVRLTK